VNYRFNAGQAGRLIADWILSLCLYWSAFIDCMTVAQWPALRVMMGLLYLCILLFFYCYPQPQD